METINTFTFFCEFVCHPDQLTEAKKRLLDRAEKINPDFNILYVSELAYPRGQNTEFFDLQLEEIIGTTEITEEHRVEYQEYQAYMFLYVIEVPNSTRDLLANICERLEIDDWDSAWATFPSMTQPIYMTKDGTEFPTAWPLPKEGYGLAYPITDEIIDSYNLNQQDQ